jgi:hypothetical protein
LKRWQILYWTCSSRKIEKEGLLLEIFQLGLGSSSIGGVLGTRNLEAPKNQDEKKYFAKN